MPSFDSCPASPKLVAEEAHQVDLEFRSSMTSFIDKCRSRITKDEEEEFTKTTLLDVKRKIVEIQSQQGKEQKMINLTRIIRFLDAVEEWGIVVDDFSDSAVFLPFVWGPVKALLQYASTFADSFEALLEAYDEIGQRLPFLKQYRIMFGRYREMRTTLSLMYRDILEFHLKALRFFSGPVWKKAFHSLWKDFKTRYSGVLRRLAQHKELIDNQAHIAHINQYQVDRTKLFEAIQSYNGFRQRLLDEIDDRVSKESQRHYNETQAWLGAPSSLTDHEHAQEKRQEYAETGRWLFHKPEMKSWKDSDTPDSSILWLNGMPGAGKTILSSQIIEECSKVSNSQTIFFYCDEKNPSKNTFLSIIKGLLSQALNQCRDDLLPQCYDRLKKNGETILQAPSQAAALLESFFHIITQTEAIVDQQSIARRQYVLIDGLDECEDAEWLKLIQFFQKTIHSFDRTHFGRLRVIFVSQHTNQIEKALKTDPGSRAHISISIRSGDNKDDIRVYTERRIISLQNVFGFDDQEEVAIVNEICDRANGMFLYAHLVIENLLRQREPRYFDEERRKGFPSGIEGAYERILKRIRRDSECAPRTWDMIQKILGWMICARRYLKWQEIQLAYCIDPDVEGISFEHQKLRLHIREDCGSLIEASSDEYVRFVHGTASRCILLAGFANEMLAEASLTTKCLQYLSMQCFAVNLAEDRLLNFALFGYYIFQEYAVANWTVHFDSLFQKMLVSTEEQLATQTNNKAVDFQEQAVQESILDEQIAELQDVLRKFICAYNGAFQATSEEKEKLMMLDQLRIADDNEDLWDDLCAVQVHIQDHRRLPFTERNKVSIGTLTTAFNHIRTFLEDPSHKPFEKKLSVMENGKLREYYGRHRYKCPKLNCPRFVEGFEDRKARQKHVERHDRPFRCEVPECPGEFGFLSSHDLQKHQRAFHPSLADQAEIFDPPPNSKNETSAKWPCPHCPKRFTRGFHLRNHIRTHNDDRPFSCTDCGKTFTRDYDRKRHEKTVHTKK